MAMTGTTSYSHCPRCGGLMTSGGCVNGCKLVFATSELAVRLGDMVPGECVPMTEEEMQSFTIIAQRPVMRCGAIEPSHKVLVERLRLPPDTTIIGAEWITDRRTLRIYISNSQMPVHPEGHYIRVVELP